jgi:CheY-like chemotaxis protein
MSFGKIATAIIVVLIGAIILYNKVLKPKEEGGFGKPGGGGNMPPMAVSAVVAAPETFSQSVKLGGTLLANDEVEIRPEISGRVTQMNISEGSEVQKGNLLLKINDDELQAQLKKLIAQMDFLHLIKECSSSVDAFDYLRSNLVDLVFLDVEMPGMTGIELLRNLHKRPIVILVTAKRNYAVEAYELDVADYIVKPVSMSRFAKAVYEARDLWDKKQKEEANEGRDYIFVRSNSILTKVKATGSM